MASVIKDEEITIPESVTITLSSHEAKVLRRICNFNKTMSKRVEEKDGAWAGAAIDAFCVNVGNQLKQLGYSRQL